MAISASDLKFLASERMIDNLSTVAGVGGGGYASQAEVIDGTANNVFPDVMPGDRVAGKQQLRQVYPIVLSADNDTLYNAAAGLSERPTDANVEVCMFTAPGNLSAQALAALGTKWTALNWSAGDLGQGPPSGGHSVDLTSVGATVPAVGDLVWLRGHYVSPSIPSKDYGLRLVTAVAGNLVTLDGGTFLADSHQIYSVLGGGYGARVSAVSLLTASATAGDDEVEVDKLWAAVQLPTASTLDTAGEPSSRKGMLPLYLPGDRVLVQSGSTRETAVVEHVNYATGVVTFVGVLANSYPSGAVLTRPVPLGSLQARADNVFSQQTWTRTWSDAAVGVSISSRYSGAIAMVNDGGVTDRWACVFTSATQYNLISERSGQIGAGNIGPTACG